MERLSSARRRLFVDSDSSSSDNVSISDEDDSNVLSFEDMYEIDCHDAWQELHNTRVRYKGKRLCYITDRKVHVQYPYYKENTYSEIHQSQYGIFSGLCDISKTTKEDVNKYVETCAEWKSKLNTSDINIVQYLKQREIGINKYLKNCVGTLCHGKICENISSCINICSLKYSCLNHRQIILNNMEICLSDSEVDIATVEPITHSEDEFSNGSNSESF